MTRKKYYNARRREKSVAKWVIIGVIIVIFILLAAISIYAFTYDEEKVVKGDLDALATEYYEEYTYPGLVDEGMSQAQINELMERYLVRGFSRVYLRQLLLRDGREKKVNEGLIKKHCDENKTYVQFFPEEPYDKKSYRVEWRYDCAF